MTYTFATKFDHIDRNLDVVGSSRCNIHIVFRIDQTYQPLVEKNTSLGVGVLNIVILISDRFLLLAKARVMGVPFGGISS